jgi:DNA-binding CsgD family transcriptional regulator
MSAAFGGQQVALPIRAISKRDEIAAMHARGIPPSEIARRLKAHERYVFRVLASLAAQSVK